MAWTARSSVARCLSKNGCDTDCPCGSTRIETLARSDPRGCADAEASAGARLVEIYHHLVRHRIALARKHEAARPLVILEREIDVHVDLAFEQPAAARRADAALAGVRQVEAAAQ